MGGWGEEVGREGGGGDGAWRRRGGREGGASCARDSGVGVAIIVINLVDIPMAATSVRSL